MSAGLRIRTGRTDALNDELRSDIVRVCNSANHTAAFNALFSFLPPEGFHIMAYAGDELASHAVVTTRWLQPEGMSILRTAYVDAVATAPAFQGKGYGGAVMRHLATAIATDYEIACLETSDQVPFYEHLGWEEWRGALAGRGENGLIPTPDQKGIMILRLPRTPALNFDGLLTIEDQGVRIW
jgi:GNAT superfamily N-acetyltransferase